MPSLLAISFLNPSLLYFAALAALPVLIYLFNRQRYTTMKWAAMDFVLRAVKTNRRRLKIENLMLLLLRVAAVSLIVLALARPVGKNLGPLAGLEDKRNHVAIVLDVSYSMGLKQGARSSFERAQKAAHDVAEDLLKRGDRVAVLLMSDAPRFLYHDPIFVDDATKTQVLKDLNEVELTAQPTDAAKTLRALAEHLPRFERSGAESAPPAGTLAKQVYIFTDLQRSAFATERGLKDPNLKRVAADLEKQKAQLTIVDCGADEVTNVAVTRLDAADEVAGVDIPLKVNAAVKNFGPAAAPADLNLELYVDTELQATTPVTLEPGEERQIERWVVFRDKGGHRVSVTLKSDNLAIDNQRSLALDVREAVDVVLVDVEQKPGAGNSETDFLAAALAPAEEGQVARDYLLRPQVVGEGQVADLDLAKQPVVVVANVISLAGEQVEKLESFVRAGGAVLFFLGAQVDPITYNEKLWKLGKGLLPAKLDRIVTDADEDRYHVLAADTFEHPALKPFATKDTRPLFGIPRFTGYWRLEWPEAAIDDPGLQCVAWFEPRKATAGGEAADVSGGPAAGAGAGTSIQRDPALAEKRFGRGRVMVFTSTADDAWNNFFAQYAYLILWQKSVTYLADAGAGRKNLVVGEPYEAIIPASEYASEILVTTPAGDQVEKTLEKIPEEPDRFRLVHAETLKPGAYEVRYQGLGHGPGPGTGTGAERVEYFAVNVEPEEGDLTRIDEQELRQLVPELKFRLEKERGADRSLRPSAASPEANELWKYALFALLGALGLESILALRFGRRAVA